MPNPRKLAAVRQSRRDYSTPKPKDGPEYPPHLAEENRATFAELVEAMPSGAAAKSDSLFIAVAAQLLNEYRQSMDFTTARLNCLRMMFAELGMTPKSRRQLELGTDPAENPFAAIDRLRNG